MKIKKIVPNTYSIVANGLFANSDLGEGRMIPALLLYSQTNNGLSELQAVHSTSPPGDIIISWAKPVTGIFKAKVWYLTIDFSQPMEFSFQILFNLKDDYSLINAIFKARGLYIGSGNKGQSVILDSKNMILLEIPQTIMDESWAETLNYVLRKKFRKERIPKHNINEEIKNHLRKMEEILSMRASR